MPKRTVLITLNVLMEVDVEGPCSTNDPDAIDRASAEVSSILEDAIEAALGEQPDHLGLESLELDAIDGDDRNSGRCVECGRWVTDCEQLNPIQALNRGATWDGRLLCDDDLPPDHRWAFKSRPFDPM